MADKEQLVTASPLGSRNSHHVRLFRQDADQKLQDEIGLVLCDNKAEENFKAIDLVHTPQESLKTSSGATEHSDFEPPYSSLELDDWSMGRGYSDHSKQKSGYLDARNMYTVKPNVLFSCGQPEVGILDLDINYSKVDYRLDVTDHDETVVLGGALNIDLEPDVIRTYGTMFETDGVYTGLTLFHMRMRAPNVTPGTGYPMVDLKLEIWEAIVDTKDETPPFTGPPWDDCWKPDDANKIATLTMPEYDWDEVNSNELNMVVWTSATPFNLTNAGDPSMRYFVTLTPTNTNGSNCNSWEVPTYNGNTLEHAPIITRWGDDYMWMQYEDTCDTRKSWKFYIDNPVVLFDYRDNSNPPTVTREFWSDQNRGYATTFKSSSDVNNIKNMVILMEYESWIDINDMRAIVYTMKSYPGNPLYVVPDAVHATLEYTTPASAPGSPAEMTFDVTSGGGSFDIAAGSTYFIAILGTPQSIDVLGWKLNEYPGNQGNPTYANAAYSLDDGVTWDADTGRPWNFPYQYKFYFAGDTVDFNHELTSGYGGESITFSHYVDLNWNPFSWTYRRALGAVFKAKTTYTNCEDFHINMTPFMNDALVHMPPLKLEIWGVKTEGSPLCKVPDPDVKIATATMTPDNALTITPDSLIGLQSGITKEIVFRVPRAATTPYDPLDFTLTGGVEYFVTLTPIEDELEYREPNIWNIEFYNANMADPAPMVWKEFLSDAWTQYDTVDCDTNRKMWKFYITGNPEDFKAHFAEIDHCLHVGIEFLDGSAGFVYRNGEIGLGLFQEYIPSAAEKKGLFKPVNSMPLVYPKVDETPNAILKITEGLGSRAFRDWTRIKSMTDLGEDTGDTHTPKYRFVELPITHQFNQENADETTAYSKYVIQNSLHFTKLDFSPVIDKPITGVLSAMGAFYVCFGGPSLLNVYRLRYLDNWTTGATTQEWVDEGYWSDMLAHQVRAGNNWIWRIKAFDSLITPADALNMHDETETGKLNFDDANEAYVGNTDYMINSYAIYGDDPHLWIMKEDMPYEIVAEDVYAFRNSAMSSMADARNSRAAIQHDTYLYFAFHDGVQRWHYGGDLLNHGPDSIGPAGLPENRRGSFAAFAGYGDLLIGAYDAGEYGFSSILVWNGTGWTELYRAGQIGERILSCYIQSMDGAPVDWLWFSEGSTIYRLPVSTNPLYLINDEFFYYKFTDSAYLDSAWISLGLKDVTKYINKFKIIATKAPSLYDMPWVDQDIEDFEPVYDGDILLEGIALAWRTDVSEGFTYYMDPTDPNRKMNMLGEVNVSAPVEAEAQQIQYRLEIKLAKNRYPIVVTDIVMDSIVRLPHKAEIRVQFRLRDQDKDRLGQPDPYPTVKEKYDILEVYTNQAAPVWAQIDAKFVGERKFFVDQGSLQVVDKLRDHNIETWVMTMVLKEA